MLVVQRYINISDHMAALSIHRYQNVKLISETVCTIIKIKDTLLKKYLTFRRNKGRVYVCLFVY